MLYFHYLPIKRSNSAGCFWKFREKNDRLLFQYHLQNQLNKANFKLKLKIILNSILNSEAAIFLTSTLISNVDQIRLDHRCKKLWPPKIETVKTCVFMKKIKNIKICWIKKRCWQITKLIKPNKIFISTITVFNMFEGYGPSWEIIL